PGSGVRCCSGAVAPPESDEETPRRGALPVVCACGPPAWLLACSDALGAGEGVGLPGPCGRWPRHRRPLGAPPPRYATDLCDAGPPRPPLREARESAPRHRSCHRRGARGVPPRRCANAAATPGCRRGGGVVSDVSEATVVAALRDDGEP